MTWLLLAVATLASEDLACIGAGLLVSQGAMRAAPAVLACFVGVLGGDLLLYAAGRWVGAPALARAPLRWLVDPSAVRRGEALFARHGASIVWSSRFLPGTRLPTYLAAGTLRVPFARFALLSAAAVAVWTPLLVGLAARFGEAFATRFADLRMRVPLLLLVALVLLAAARVVPMLATWRGRRLLLSRWRRLVRWEFWPMWAFYPPVLLYVAWLALRHRSITLPTCVNPAMPGGGIAGESKGAILAALARGSDRVAPFRLLRAHELAEDGERRVLEAMAALDASWPVVLKPDVGERGSGVGIIRSPAMLRDHLARSHGDLIVQRYVPGVEAGLFYYRLPGEARGHLFAITEKRLPAVTGDGRRTLEELILADDRAVCSARFFLARHAERLATVPAPGETVTLAELGTHCRGAAFFDGERWRTPALEAAVHEVSSGFPGFWFGRYDVRSPSWEALQRGQFSILELNGATSEATSIYDPAHGVTSAWRTLMRQWAILFEIAARNRRAGARPASLQELLALLRRHRGALAGHARA